MDIHQNSRKYFLLPLFLLFTKIALIPAAFIFGLDLCRFDTFRFAVFYLEHEEHPDRLEMGLWRFRSGY